MNYSNGRVNINEPNISAKFNMMDKIPIDQATNYNNVLTGTFESSKLSEKYFSKENIDYIQHKLQEGVLHLSKNQINIDRQPNDSIVTVMRSMFFLHSLNQENNIEQQINTLNKHVLNYCIPHVYNEAVAYINYRNDVSQMYKPIAHPIHSSTTKKSLELTKRWF